jgi:selenide,water dikinase
VSTLKVKADPRLIVGLATPDDAGVYQLTDHVALIQTLDFFTPIVDSPYDFGAIAAANALSDVYAMGGQPLTAMNIVCFPSDELPESILKETLAGGLEKIHEAGALLVGGHSVNDAEFKYGLSVTGTVHPDRVITNSGLKIQDRLILTKPIGTGILATAIKGKLAAENAIKNLVAVASSLNKTAAEIMGRFKPSACTDITGFGLAGHLVEMAAASKKKINLYADDIPFIEDVYDLAAMGMFPAGAYHNKKFFEIRTRIASEMDPVLTDLMFDPQTSGGLVISLNKTDALDCLNALHDNGIGARIIGDVESDDPCGFVNIF